MDFSLQDDGGDFSATNATRASDSERNFGDLEDDDDDILGSKKGRTKVEEAAPGVATGMILSLRESLRNCKDELASCQNELESAKAEINKWKSAFQNESFVPPGKTPEPRFLIDYIQNLKSSERSLKEQLEIAKRKEASCIVQYEKREQEMAELKSAVRDLKSQLKPASMQNLVEEKDKKEPFSLRGNALSTSSEEPLSLGEDDIPSYGEYLTGSPGAFFSQALEQNTSSTAGRRQ